MPESDTLPPTGLASGCRSSAPSASLSLRASSCSRKWGDRPEVWVNN